MAEIIEETPRAKDLEMAWYRDKKKLTLRSAAKERTAKSISPLPPERGETSLRHTHVWPKKPSENSMPSFGDLCAWFQLFPKGIKYNHIAQLNEDGKVIGYSSFSATNTLFFHLQKARENLEFSGNPKLNPEDYLLFKIIDKVSDGKPESVQEEKMRKLITDFLIKNRFFIMHKKPFKGYYFNEKTERFEKIVPKERV